MLSFVTLNEITGDVIITYQQSFTPSPRIYKILHLPRSVPFISIATVHLLSVFMNVSASSSSPPSSPVPFLSGSPLASSPSSLGSIPSPSRFQDIKLRDCLECKTEDYTRLPSGELRLNLKLCSLHQSSLLASPTRRRSQPAARRPLSLSPVGAGSPVLHRATQALVPSRRGGATPPDADNRRITRPVNRSTSSPPTSRRRLNTDPPSSSGYTSSSVPGEALDYYGRIRTEFLGRPDPSITFNAFLKENKIAPKSWYRKRKIAELMILDMDRFDSLVKQILKEQRTDRINQQTLSDRCGTILNSADYLQKRKRAVASGELI